VILTTRTAVVVILYSASIVIVFTNWALLLQ